MTTQTEALKLALEALSKVGYVPDAVNPHPISIAIAAIKEALSSPNGEAQPEQKMTYQQAAQLINEMKSQPEQEHDCTRSHPHENMSKECELRTEIARLTNQQTQRSQAQLQLKMTALEKAWFYGYENDIESAMRDLREQIINPILAQPEQEPVAAIKLLNRLERNWHRMGELWERCQGKGWPDAESDEFTALRDEKMPANRKALLALFDTTPPQRKPLTDEQIVQLSLEWPAETNDWASHIDFARAIEAAHGIKGD